MGKKKEEDDSNLTPAQRYLKEQKEKYKPRGRVNKKQHEVDTYKKLLAFKRTLQQDVPTEESPDQPEPERPADRPVPILSLDVDGEVINGVDWMAHKLIFEKTAQLIDPMARDDEDYVVIDVRHSVAIVTYITLSLSPANDVRKTTSRSTCASFKPARRKPSRGEID